MTRFVNASARQTAEAKLKALKGIDSFLFESFAREALIYPDALPSRQHAALLGRLVLLAALRWIKEKNLSLTDDAALLTALVPLSENLCETHATLRAFSRATDALLSRVSRREAARATRFEIGSDGHAVTREACARLNLARHYERASGEFADLIERIVQALASWGPAYGLWEARTPLLFCNANLSSHRRVAREMARLEAGGVALVTPPLLEKAQKDMAGDAALKNLPVLIDREGLLHELLAPGNPPIFLLERRLAGWTLTYPLGGADPREARNRKLPAWARALAFADVGESGTEEPTQ